MLNYSLKICNSKSRFQLSRFLGKVISKEHESKNAVIQGCAAAPGYYVGKACVIKNMAEDAHKFRPGS